ncbi:MAG: GNAT family N-acetyltransferase [Chitinophagaceae bacterium]
MIENILSVREIQEADIDAIVEYWLGSERLFLISMGVDVNKLPTRDQLTKMLLEQMQTPIEQKKSYCIIWQVDGKSIGHSNTNPTVFGKEAYMHLHLWDTKVRKKGFGAELVKMTLPYFFETLKLNKLISEPYSLNPAPNKTLEKVGFEFVKEYITTPGSLNFEQLVKRWELSYEKFKQLE